MNEDPGAAVGAEDPAASVRPRRKRCTLTRGRCLLVWVILLALPFGGAVYAYAQAAVVAQSVDFFGDLWAKIQQAGPFAALVAVYFMIKAEKRADRQDVQRDGLLERVVTAINNSSTTVESQNKIIERQNTAIGELTRILAGKAL